MTFTPAHDQDLGDYFSGRMLADMGMRSPDGHSLDRAHAASVSEDAPAPPREQDKGECGGYLPVEVRKCHETVVARGDATEISPAALHAARRMGHVREVLARLDRATVLVLRAYYTQLPPGWYGGLHELRELAPVACHLEGTQRMRDLCRQSEARVKPGMTQEQKAAVKAAKQAARQERDLAAGRARKALRDAQAAYAEAAAEVKQGKRRERLNRFRSVVGV